MRFEIGISLIALTALVCGCGGSNAPPPQTVQGSEPLPVMGMATGQTSGIEDAVRTDPSTARLLDIMGDLLIYFRINKAMPATLEDLHSVDAQLILIAPSNQPYEYYPQGLALPNPNEPLRLVVADPVERQDGRRLCILAQVLRPGAPLVGDVRPIPEVTYAAYRFNKTQ